MKTAIKAFIIISMIFGVFAVYPLVLGIFALKKLDEARTAEELKGWAVVTLIFVNIISGVLMLCLKDDDLVDNYREDKSQHKQNIARIGKNDNRLNTDINKVIIAEIYE